MDTTPRPAARMRFPTVGYRWENLPPPLPADEQGALFTRLNAPDTSKAERQQIRERLCLHNLRIVQTVATATTRSPQQAADVWADGVVGLLHAIDVCDPARAGQFYSFARRAVHGEIVKGMRRDAGLTERRGRDASAWRRWEQVRRAAGEPATPEAAVEAGVFGTVGAAHAARVAAHREHSLEVQTAVPGGETGVSGLWADDTDTEARQAALSRLARVVEPGDLETLLGWAGDGCPQPMPRGVAAALRRAVEAAGGLQPLPLPVGVPSSPEPPVAPPVAPPAAGARRVVTEPLWVDDLAA